jgi:hypothetical protein
MGDSFDAHRLLYWYDYWRGLGRTSFPHFYHQALAEMSSEARAARKLFAQADQMWKRDEPPEAVAQTYEQAFAQWQTVLRKYRGFRQDELVQDETCALELRYWRPLQRARGTTFKQLLIVQDYLSRSAAPVGVPAWVPSVHVVPGHHLPVPIEHGPLDSDTIRDEAGAPLLPPEAMGRARSQMAQTGE